MFLKLILNNIASFIRTKPILFVFMIITQIVCIIAVLSVTGMMDSVSLPQSKDGEITSFLRFYIPLYNYNENQESEEKESQKEEVQYVDILDTVENKYLYSGILNDDANKILNNHKNPIDVKYSSYTPINKGMKYKFVREKIDEIIKSAGKDFRSTLITCETDSNNLAIDCYCDVESIGKKTGTVSIKRNPAANTPYKNLNKGDLVRLGNTDYVVSEVEEKSKNPDGSPAGVGTLMRIDYSDIDDDLYVEYMMLEISEMSSQATIAEITRVINENFGNLGPEFEKPEAKPLMEQQFNNMIYVVSFIMIAVVILNISRLYTFIMASRKKSLAVFSLCGACKTNVLMIYVLEILFMLIFSYAVGVILFRVAVIDLVSIAFPTVLTFYTNQVYAIIFGIYVGVGAFVMTGNIIPIIRQTITELTKGGNL